MATQTKQVNVGVIGCGNISSIYFESPKKFDILNIVACADIFMDAAKAQAAKFGIPKACTPEELLADPSIDIVINLTVPLVHGEVALKALQAGKSVYNEKPLSYQRADAARLLEVAKQKGLLVGGAPDTFLGGGLQTCRELIDAGEIGAPVHAAAYMLSRGMESWHPNPEFFFQPGGGPMFDMGPYYLTALVALLGPVKRVAGMTAITHPERTVTSQPRFGQKIKVNTPTTVTGLIEFAGAGSATLVTSFDVSEGYLPQLTIYGTKGTLQCSDPNTFGGPVRLKRHEAKDFEEIPISRPYTENSRGLGVADMAYALRNGRTHRANGGLAYHVVDMMHAFHESAASGHYSVLDSQCSQPEPLSAAGLTE